MWEEVNHATSIQEAKTLNDMETFCALVLENADIKG